MNVITITSLVIDITITIVGEMSDSSFEDSVVYLLTASHLTLKCLCGYPPVMRRVSSIAATKSCLAFDHKLGSWLDWFCIRSQTSSFVSYSIVGVATPDYTTL